MTKFYWWETSHYYFSSKGIKCSQCGKVRKRLMRINYPKASNVPSNDYEVTKGYPENNPYNDWLCMKCWRTKITEINGRTNGLITLET